MTRWVVRYRIANEAPTGDLDRLARDKDVTLIDRTGRGLALVDVPAHALPRIRGMLPGWTVEPEREGWLP